MRMNSAGSGKVAMFRLRPNYGLLLFALIVLLLGLFGYAEMQREAETGNIDAQGRARLILVITVIICGISVIVATARLWFRHLWGEADSRLFRPRKPRRSSLSHRKRPHRSRRHHRSQGERAQGRGEERVRKHEQ
ncbi:hypothetical protein [Kiritimatiella glycovorans]|uniref:Uncharacterized protein n=1 Tax=Kiritimatiella glycovorans TaxID=1307763 RepID=A0A0G3EKU8_9BACT|nr:hypothetical protein [Kiritimatiella glycovorans]AKJ65380.1 hypothetical protein L21SP4_02151 [Kiritimatiella glycovorans]